MNRSRSQNWLTNTSSVPLNVPQSQSLDRRPSLRTSFSSGSLPTDSNQSEIGRNVGDFNVTHTSLSIPTFKSVKYTYAPIEPYWFYSKQVQGRLIWIPFSLVDAQQLDEAYANNTEIIATNGNRYDVNLHNRQRTPVYWEEASNEVRRSKWFYLPESENRFIPYDEKMNDILETLYEETCRKQTWHQKHSMNDGKEILIFHSPVLITVQAIDAEITHWSNFSYETLTVKRGLPEMFFEEIRFGDKKPVQHLFFVVHGIGEGCRDDTHFRPLVECVEDFRETSRTILQSHFKTYLENGEVHRVEFLPVYWHGDLHMEATGVDEQLSHLTLPSVAKLRTFINNTLSDILFYTSPVYCQKIISRCIREMNRLYDIFLTRNPSFTGRVSVIGHSLGSVILYDILVNQTPADAQEALVNEQENSQSKQNTCVSGTGQVSIQYEKLTFPIAYFFALGSPIAMFLTIRGITSLANDYALPTCLGLLNIFHPYDPVAYRLEPLIDPNWTVSPVLLPHHKGRKRVHLELIDGLSKATDLKQKMIDTFRNTMISITDYVASYRSPNAAVVIASTTTEIVSPTIEETRLELEHANDTEETQVTEWNNCTIGRLNQGRRIDYVLQHRPIEVINEYLFAFASHTTYWDSEDTMLLIMKEVLKLDNFEPETQYETLEQMIKSNVLNYFVTNQTTKINELRRYLAQSEQTSISTSDLNTLETD